MPNKNSNAAIKLMPALGIAACLIMSSCLELGKPAEKNNAPEGQEAAELILPVIPPVVFAAPVVSKTAASRSRSLEKKADKMRARLAKTWDREKALELAGEVMDMYKKAISLDYTDDELVHKYVRMIELKYNLIIPDEERVTERRSVYAGALKMLEQLHPGKNNSIYSRYDTALLLILNNENYIVFQVIAAMNRTNELCTEMYNEDRTFEDYGAAIVLGRINLLVPNIPFLLGWPDKNRSRQYLEEALAAHPDSLLTKFFLADTLYALNEKDKAAEYFRGVMAAEPRRGINYFQDLKIQLNCGKRMKELNIIEKQEAVK